MELTAEEWLSSLGMEPGDAPEAIITEGSWWREQRTAWRLGRLENVRELGFPDMFTGTWKGRRILYCCAYGAARVVEPVHLFSLLGARLAIQIGTCGGLQPEMNTGLVVVPDVAVAREGVAALYGVADCVEASGDWNDRAQADLEARGVPTLRGVNLTWTSLFAQTGEICANWRRAGYHSVDMETATTFGVARHFGVPAVSMLVTWDELSSGRTFLDPLDEEETAALDRGNEAVFETALSLVEVL